MHSAAAASIGCGVWSPLGARTLFPGATFVSARRRTFNLFDRNFFAIYFDYDNFATLVLGLTLKFPPRAISLLRNLYRFLLSTLRSLSGTRNVST